MYEPGLIDFATEFLSTVITFVAISLLQRQQRRLGEK